MPGRAQQKGSYPHAVDFLAAVEHLTLKEVNTASLPRRAREVSEAIARLYPILPLYITGTIVMEQLQHVMMEQVRRGGPTHAHGTLDVENMMTFFKQLCTSRKNLAEGMARQYAPSEMAFHWNLSEGDLEPPDIMREDFVCHADSGKRLPPGSPTEQPLDSVIGLLVDSDEVPDELRRLLREFCAQTKYAKLEDYRPTCGPVPSATRQQTIREQRLVAQCQRLTSHKWCDVRGVRFATKKHCADLKTDNSCFSVPFVVDGRQQVFFGRIRSLLSVKVGKVKHFAAMVEWWEEKRMLYDYLPIVTKMAKGSSWNRETPAVRLSQLYAQNVAFWPAWNGASSREHIAIWRNSSHRVHHK
jgi:hypothetical protein